MKKFEEFDIVDFQKKTINATIDTFVRECEHYIYNNQCNAYGYFDMSDLRAIAKRMKGEQTKWIIDKCY